MSDLNQVHPLPELLCPVGSPEALDAAIEGGANAVYLGGSLFNARMNAKNFDSDALRAAVLRAHTYGVKVYLTLNTLATDREMNDYLAAAKDAYLAGVDALIVADLGGAALIHRAIPDMELHASTQMSGHCASMGAELKELGFSRMVIARETSAEDIAAVVKTSPIEVEVFIHGALCVSHSGQCLFSSLVGGRSGNRGECAQPCRLPYSCAQCKSGEKSNAYPLSLKDLTLASHVPELIRSGVSSLKIEGRMKSPEYVYETARVWRRLLDERRAATRKELDRLAAAFSRGGFTDGYFTKQIDRRMLGIRSKDDKLISKQIEPFAGLSRKIALDIHVEILSNRPMTLTLSNGEQSVTVAGNVPMTAINAPLNYDAVKRSLTKFGGTAYEARSFTLQLDEGLMLPVSRLNDLRRRAIEAWETPSGTQRSAADFIAVPLQSPKKKQQVTVSARFYSSAQITPRAKRFFDRIALPIDRFTSDANCALLSPVIFDSVRDQAKVMIDRAIEQGATSLMLGNLGHLELVKNSQLPLIGDFRLNVTNSQTVAQLESIGFEELLLSPELTLPQMRDVKGNTSAIVYGRIPLMTLEKCIIRETADCDVCHQNRATVTDRRGISFPVLREWEHRNIIYNSLPTSMSDRADELVRYGLCNRHFIFSTETPEEVDAVINAFEKGLPLNQKVRRLAK